MENQFTNQMKKVSSIKLEEIISKSQNYDSLAVEAAKKELEFRKSNEINSESKDLSNFSENEKKSNLYYYSIILNIWAYISLSLFVFTSYGLLSNSLEGGSNNLIEILTCISLFFSFTFIKFFYHVGIKIDSKS